MMLISVIIPTYKPEDYLFDCLFSIKNQTISHESFEIIIVLNGCKYPYQEQIEIFMEKHFEDDIKIKMIQTDIIGVSQARNVGIDAAEGEYIAFVDDDDMLSNNYLESLIQVSDRNAIAVANVKVFQNDLNVLSDDYISKSYLKNLTTSHKAVFSMISFFSSSCAKLINKKIIKNRRFDTHFKMGEDSLFMFAISDEIKEVRLANAIYYRRRRQSSASQSKKQMNEKIANAWALIVAFSSVYFRNLFSYRFTLYFSRIGAVLLNVFR